MIAGRSRRHESDSGGRRTGSSLWRTPALRSATMEPWNRHDPFVPGSEGGSPEFGSCKQPDRDHRSFITQAIVTITPTFRRVAEGGAAYRSRELVTMAPFRALWLVGALLHTGLPALAAEGASYGPHLEGF